MVGKELYDYDRFWKGLDEDEQEYLLFLREKLQRRKHEVN